jgi:hypothetical protein
MEVQVSSLTLWDISMLKNPVYIIKLGKHALDIKLTFLTFFRLGDKAFFH